MKALIVGGTRYFGKRLAKNLIVDGHEVFLMSRSEPPKELKKAWHFKIDREEEIDKFKEVFEKQNFDVVFDQVCFAPDDAKRLKELLEKTNTRHIHTSTASVYEQTGERFENQFNPKTAPLTLGSRAEFTFPSGYGAGKRMCEAVLFQGAADNVAAMRIPVVLGPDDYTERLLNLVRRIKTKQPIIVPNPQARVSFVHAADAARALLWLATQSVNEAINIAAPQTISIGELIALAEEATGTKAELVKSGSAEWHNQFVEDESLTLNVNRAAELGFTAEPLMDWLPELVRGYAK